MDKELEKYYNNFFEMFRTEGWKQLLEEVENNVEQTNNLEITKDEQDLYFRKGQLVVMNNIINLETQVAHAREQAELDDAQD